MSIKSLSISGKGGSGKTTFTALLLKNLVEYGNYNSILVIDGDPAANLPDVLGVQVEKTVGDVIDEYRRRVAIGETFPPHVFEAKVFEALIETPKFDLLVMGKTEGKGCYCYVNAVLAQIVQTLMENYDLIIFDMEAGLEHIARRVDTFVDMLVIITDPSKMGFSTTEKIVEMVRKSEDIKIRDVYVVGNKFDSEEPVKKLAEKLGIGFGGVIPYDENVQKFNLEGKPLLELPSDSPAVKAVREIAKRLGLL